MPIWAWKKNARAPHPRSAFMVAPNVALLLLEAAHGDERVVTFENIYIWHTVCSYATIDQRAFSEPDRDHDRIDGSKRGRNAERHVCSDSAWAAKKIYCDPRLTNRARTNGDWPEGGLGTYPERRPCYDKSTNEPHHEAALGT